MGMDMYIDRVRKKPTGKEEREELCYWRKFWDLHDELGLYGEDDYGNDVPMTKDDVLRAIEFSVRNVDYFGGFSGVEQLCELLRDYDSHKEEGWDIVYNANW
jgi:hypothetical protein